MPLHRQSDRTLAPGDVVLEHYRVTGLLAHGGQALIYTVKNEAGRSFALKVARADGLDHAGEDRLKLEALVLSGVESPVVVRYVASGYDRPSGRYCLVEELVPGVPLSVLLARRERLRPHRAVALLSQLAQGLEALHATGYVMRDLSPGQVMVSRDRGRLQARLIDLGLARPSRPEEGLTDPAAVVGTPGYLAPELVTGATPSPASDVYSLAALAWELYFGAPVFAQGEAAQVLAAQLAEALPPAPVRGLLARVHPLLVRAMAKEPGVRPRGPTELTRLLAEVTRSHRRRRVWIVSGSALLVAAAIVLLVAFLLP